MHLHHLAPVEVQPAKVVGPKGAIIQQHLIQDALVGRRIDQLSYPVINILGGFLQNAG